MDRFVGSEWRTFCGYGPDRVLSLATAALDDLGYEYARETVATTGAERTMLGADETGDRIAVSDPVAFEVEVVRATADPLTGAALSTVLGSNRRESATAGLSVVTLREVNDETRPAMAAFVNRVIERGDRPPWDVRHHVGLRLAVLLRLKIKLLWGYWRDRRSDRGSEGRGRE